MGTEQYIEQFEREYQSRFEPRTIKGYQLAVRQIQDHLEIPFEQITIKHIRDWSHKLEEKGCKPNSIKNKLIGLRTYYNYCLEKEIELINSATDITLPTVIQNVPNYLTKPQLASLREQVEGSLIERAIIEMVLTTGIRISELVALKKEDINWSERSLLIPEGKSRKRTIIFSIECGRHLKNYLESRTDDLLYVFINKQATARIRPQTIKAYFHRYSERLEFRITPRILWHTFIAHQSQ